MRRTLTITAIAVGLTALHAAPALAVGVEAGEVAKGSFQGIVLALVFGLLLGTFFTLHAYRRVGFGEAPEHHEQADDIRQGMSDYDPDVPDGSA